MNSKKIELYKKSLKLSDIQRKILVGVLLGDAHLETQNNGRTYRVKFEYSVSHKEYVYHLYEVFKEWVTTEPQLKCDKTHNNIWFQTISHPAFRFYAHQFYRNQRKCVPVRIIHKLLSEVSLAYWYMDDGSIKSKESKAVLFNTQGFCEKEVEKLCEVLAQRFGLEATKRKQKEGWQIYISERSYERFVEIVLPYIVPSMMYKIPPERQHKCLKGNGGVQRFPQGV
jgi:DNA-binding transcriptional regulator WhiA